MSDAEQTVRDFMAAFATRDVDHIMSFFAEDAVYHNMPMKPVSGTEAIRGLIHFFVDPADSIEFEVRHISSTGGTVLTERMDRFVTGNKSVDLPVMGTFEVNSGKITAWRDYFDMATWQKQAGQ